MAMPVLGGYFRKMGVLPAAPDSIAGALAAGRDVALWPGGERRLAADLAPARPGGARRAHGLRQGRDPERSPDRAGRAVGGPDSMPVLATGRRLAKLLALDRVARLKTFPIAIQAPWGVSPALLPEIPLPTKIRTEFQEAIEVDHDPERADDERYVKAKYREVRDSIQAGMGALARRRRFPLLG